MCTIEWGTGGAGGVWCLVKVVEGWELSHTVVRFLDDLDVMVGWVGSGVHQNGLGWG